MDSRSELTTPGSQQPYPSTIDSSSSTPPPSQYGSKKQYQKWREQRQIRRAERQQQKQLRIQDNPPIHFIIIKNYGRVKADNVISKEKYRFVASYSITDDTVPTILVPGAPALWDPQQPLELPIPDKGTFKPELCFVPPARSFTPFFAALEIMAPDYSLKDISLVTDEKCLLYIFNTANRTCNTPDGWRLAAEVVGDTLILAEAGNADGTSGPKPRYSEMLDEKFKKQCLKYENGFRDTKKHYRIVEYEIEGLKCLVRYEVDGYLRPYRTQRHRETGDLLRPLVGMNETHVGPELQPVSSQEEPEAVIYEDINVIQKGFLVPDGSILTFRCRGMGVQVKDKVLTCWFTQTKHLIMARIQEKLTDRMSDTVSPGTDEEIESPKKNYQEPVYDIEGFVDMNGELAQRTATWEKQCKHSLKRMLLFIKKISEAAKQLELKKCSVTYHPRDYPEEIEIFKTDIKTSLVSEEVRTRYWSEISKEHFQFGSGGREGSPQSEYKTGEDGFQCEYASSGDDQSCLQLGSCENEFEIDSEDSEDWFQFKQLQ